MDQGRQRRGPFKRIIVEGCFLSSSRWTQIETHGILKSAIVAEAVHAGVERFHGQPKASTGVYARTSPLSESAVLDASAGPYFDKSADLFSNVEMAKERTVPLAIPACQVPSLSCAWLRASAKESSKERRNWKGIVAKP